MTFLLDVNVLIALVDQRHAWHEPAHGWFSSTGMHSWATCPITENGLARIVGRASYPNHLGTPGEVVALLEALRCVGQHHFWPDSVSLVDGELVRADRLGTAAQVTDSYLLALAVANGGKLATFDRRLSTSAINGGDAALAVI